MASGVPTEKVLPADLSEFQFLRLASAVARLSDSPLGILKCREDEPLGERLELARWAPGAEVGICDWIVSPLEVRVAQRSERGVWWREPGERPEGDRNHPSA